MNTAVLRLRLQQVIWENLVSDAKRDAPDFGTPTSPFNKEAYWVDIYNCVVSQDFRAAPTCTYSIFGTMAVVC